MIELREYQKQAIQRLRQSIGGGSKRPILQLPTGSGKTEVAVEIIKSAVNKGKRVCFFVDKLALVDQTSRRFMKYGIDHGIIQGNNVRTNYSKPVQIASVQTYIKRKPWEFDLAIVDECHVVYNKLFELMQRWNGLPFIGLTATPYTQGLGNIYTDLINVISISELIEQGFLVDSDMYGPSQPDMTGVSIVGGDFNQKQAAEKTMEKKLIGSVIDTWHQLGENRQTICFATDINHSKYLAEEFQATGVDCVHVDTYTDTAEKREKIDAFNNGEVKMITSVGILTTGFDSPSAQCAIIARPTKSLSLHIQMIGRVLRPYEGKEKAIILDHAGNFERLGFHTDNLPNELDVHKKGEKKKQKKEEPLPKACPKCHVLKPVKAKACPNCGFITKSQNELFEEAGTLVKLKKANKEVRKEEKQSFYSGLLGYADNKGYSQGWASHKYKEKFGVWPNAMNKVKTKPTEIVLNYIRHINIKYAKSKERRIS
jgi:superfamily II DNA or RNA helicase